MNTNTIIMYHSHSMVKNHITVGQHSVYVV